MQRGAGRGAGSGRAGKRQERAEEVSIAAMIEERRELLVEKHRVEARIALLSQQIRASVASELTPAGVGLSPRQNETLQLVLVGKCNKEIASELNITVRTVKFHVSELLRKFQVSTREQLATRQA